MVRIPDDAIDQSMDTWCCECGLKPARMWLPDTKRRICGVCAHQLAIAQNLAGRVKAARVGNP